MRKGLVSFIIILCMLIPFTVGCQSNSTDTASPTQMQNQTTPPELSAQETEGNGVTTEPNATAADSMPETVPESTVPSSTEPSTQETEPEATAAPTEPPRETAPPVTEEPEPTEPKPTQPKPTGPAPTTPVPTEPKPTEPPITEPPVTDPISTDPPPTESVPTEPAGCIHEWICVHHNAEGHWRAGIVCDCGWTVYGNPSELVSMWNAHSASYPPAESLFDHGGYGSADEWIIDKPAYDEWICKHCGEPRP